MLPAFFLLLSPPLVLFKNMFEATKHPSLSVDGEALMLAVCW